MTLYEKYKNASLDDLNKDLVNACIEGELEIVQYLLSSTDLKQHADINDEDCLAFCFACSTGNLDIVKYMLTSPELKIHVNINAKEGEPLSWACENGQLEVVKYLLSSSDLKEHANLHINNDNPFAAAHMNYHDDITNFLIFGCNIERNNNIRRILAEKPDEQIDSWFKLRDLNKELNSDLINHESNLKKPKL